MSLPSHSCRPLASFKQAIRQCRAERYQARRYATTEVSYPSLEPRWPPPSPGFRPSQATKQNRFEQGMRKIRVYPAIRSATKTCTDPIKAVTDSQIAVLDPTGARTRLFSPANPDRVKPGDILHVRLKSGEPFSGMCLNIRQRHQPIDTAILLRNTLTRVGTEMWLKVYSPNVEGIEIVQRKEKRARRAKLYYMRQPRHDMGSVDGMVRQYLRQRAGGPMRKKDSKGRGANANRKKNKKKGKN